MNVNEQHNKHICTTTTTLSMITFIYIYIYNESYSQDHQYTTFS